MLRKFNFFSLLFCCNTMVYAQALAGGGLDTGFINSVKGLFCSVIGKSGPIVPLVSGAALVVFSCLLLLGANADGGGHGTNLKTTYILKPFFGIALLVFVPNILNSAFGINVC